MMEWIPYNKEEFYRLGPDTRVILTDGTKVFARATLEVPAGVTHYLVLPNLPTLWWEELPEEAVWFEIDYGANGREVYARSLEDGIWYYLSPCKTDGEALERLKERRPTARLIKWR